MKMKMKQKSLKINKNNPKKQIYKVKVNQKKKIKKMMKTYSLNKMLIKNRNHHKIKIKKL